ncbi:hypothetical protein Tco_1181591 [Tanacetum coccineum]
MTTLQFVDTHNLVVFLAKPAECEGFEQIVDFLNANPIRYALTINPTIYTSCIEQSWDTVKVKTVNGEVQLQALVDGKKIIVTEASSETGPIFNWMMRKKQKLRRPKKKDTQVPPSSVPSDNVADEAVNEEMDDSLERAATTATSLDAEQDRCNIDKTQSKATPNEPSSPGTSSGGGPRRQETMGDTIAQTRFENVSKTSNDSLLAGVNTPRSDEDSLKLKELMEFYTKLQQRVLDLENTKTAQAHEITSLKLRVKKLEKKKRVKNSQAQKIIQGVLDVLKKSAKPKDKGDVIEESSIPVSALAKVSVATITTATIPTPRKGIVIQEADTTTTPTTIIPVPKPSKKDKGKGIMVEEPVAKIKADQLLAKRLQAREQEELTIEEKAKLFQQLLEKRRKHFAAKRAEEIRNRPPTRAQQRSIMCTYLKNMEG